MIKLLNIQLTGMLGINRFLHTRDKGTKARMALIGVTVLIGVGVLAAALFMLCDTVLPVLRTLRMTGLLPPMLYALSSVMCLITSLQTGAGALFDTRDVQILLPMPLRTRTIVCARLMGLYVVDLLVELVAFVPVMVQYARYTNALPGAYIAACVLGALSLPVLPLLLGTALGTLIRSADAFGACGVLTTGHAADFYDPQCLRATIGTLFARPFAALESMQDALDWAASLPVRLNIVGTSAHGTCLLEEVDLTGPTLLLVGNETFGLSKGWKEHCDVLAKIPIQGSASSLNAGCAASICLYEIDRQRRQAVPAANC